MHSIGAGARTHAARAFPARLGRASLLSALAALGLAGCARGFHETVGLRALVAQQDYETALEQLKPLDNAGSRLLYDCERGLILHEQGRYAESNQAFEHAHNLLQDLYTRSLAREIGALLTTDLIVEYRGERYEAGLVHYYKIMNSLRLGKLEDAGVEARRLNQELQVFRDRGGSFYTDDPFLQYLTGLVYSLAGDVSDADVSLRAARRGYAESSGTYGVAPPPGLLCDLALNARRLGSLDDARAYRAEGGCGGDAEAEPATGVVHLLLEYGNAPLKVENEVVLPIFKDEVKEKTDGSALAKTLVTRHGLVVEEREIDYVLRVAMPALLAAPDAATFAEIRPIAGGDSVLPAVRAALAHDAGALAARAFEEREGEILLRTVTRAVAKYLAKRGTEKKHGAFAGWVMNMLGVATESADTRTWSTLPGKIFAARLELPPGTYALDVEFRDAAGRAVGGTRLDQVTVRAGQSQLLSARVR